MSKMLSNVLIVCPKVELPTSADCFGAEKEAVKVGNMDSGYGSPSFSSILTHVMSSLLRD